MIIYFVVGVMQNTLHTLSHLIPTTHLWSRHTYHQPCFIDKLTEAGEPLCKWQSHPWTLSESCSPLASLIFIIHNRKPQIRLLSLDSKNLSPYFLVVAWRGFQKLPLKWVRPKHHEIFQEFTECPALAPKHGINLRPTISGVWPTNWAMAWLVGILPRSHREYTSSPPNSGTQIWLLAYFNRTSFLNYFRERGKIMKKE